jgi:thymidylate kinase
MIVICLEGCHGSGKTSLLSELANAGFNVLDEAFIDMPSYTKSLHPQSLLMESMWVCQWFERLLKRKSVIETDHGADAIYFADRSPYSAVFYSRGGRGELLSPLIRAQIQELQEVNIEVITVYVKVRKTVLWERIQDRLRREPSRQLFSENKREWMEHTLEFYEKFDWDCTIDNSESSVDSVMENLVARISRQSPRFQRIVSTDGGGAGAMSALAAGNFTPRVRAASLCSSGVDDEEEDDDDVDAEDGDDGDGEEDFLSVSSSSSSVASSSSLDRDDMSAAAGPMVGEAGAQAHSTPVQQRKAKPAPPRALSVEANDDDNAGVLPSPAMATTTTTTTPSAADALRPSMESPDTITAVVLFPEHSHPHHHEDECSGDNGMHGQKKTRTRSQLHHHHHQGGDSDGDIVV